MQDIPINRIDKKSMEIDNDIKKYEGNNCKKFYGIISDARLKYLTKSIRRIPPQNLRLKNTSFYYLSPIYKGNFAYDLSTDLIADWAGTVFSAMQFIFYTNPKRIFLIGCDCSNGHAFKTPEAFDLYNTQKQGWLKVKEFRDNYYPNTEIISVNPVGLKGVFRDVYTKEYLHKHPEINSDGLEILEDGEIK